MFNMNNETAAAEIAEKTKTVFEILQAKNGVFKNAADEAWLSENLSSWLVSEIKTAAETLCEYALYAADAYVAYPKPKTILNSDYMAVDLVDYEAPSREKAQSLFTDLLEIVDHIAADHHARVEQEARETV